MKKIYVVVAELKDDVPEFFFEDDLEGIVKSFDKKTQMINEAYGEDYLFVKEFLPNPSLKDLVEDTDMVWVLPFEKRIFDSAIFDEDDHCFDAFCSAFKEWAQKVNKKNKRF